MIKLQVSVMVFAVTLVPVTRDLNPAFGQTSSQTITKPSFEVASVKPNKSGVPAMSIETPPGGRFIATNVDLGVLIRNAYGLQESQLAGLPDWTASERFDIVAKAEQDIPRTTERPSPYQLMLQSLLEERFNLRVHTETRDLPGYALVVVRSDGKFGPRLKVHGGECDRAAGSATAPRSSVLNCGTRTNMAPTGGKTTGSGIRMETFARNLAGFTGRYVVDRTGLPGSYDFEIEFTPDQSPDTTGPSIFTAVQEQLGLKLDSVRVPTEVLVIDSIERPTPD
jgi:uncharacterized protein (TIGR03435 family)